MPQFTNKDRMVIEGEGALWAAYTILRDVGSSFDNAWTVRTRTLADECKALARELRDYNDQWEESD